VAVHPDMSEVRRHRTSEWSPFRRQAPVGCSVTSRRTGAADHPPIVLLWSATKTGLKIEKGARRPRPTERRRVRKAALKCPNIVGDQFHLNGATPSDRGHLNRISYVSHQQRHFYSVAAPPAPAPAASADARRFDRAPPAGATPLSAHQPFDVELFCRVSLRLLSLSPV
jgi:hypothetical protein